MSVLLVQLSDLHIKGVGDHIQNTVLPIAGAIQNLSSDVTAVIVAVTGDVVYSGDKDQYEAACGFFGDLVSAIRSSLQSKLTSDEISIAIVAVPGNHDCDFGETDVARHMVLDSVLADQSTASDQSVIRSCTAPQANFFEYISGFTTVGLGAEIAGYDSHLACRHTLLAGKHSVSVLCFNTAWMSRKNEKQGQLFFPPSAVPSRSDVAEDLVIAMFHHPYRWLEADSSREFQRRVEAVSHFTLTGHDHDPQMTSQETATGYGNLIVEGGILQGGDSAHPSSFNAFVINVAHRTYKYASFAWQSDHYSLANGGDTGDGFGLEWKAFPKEVSRPAREFSPSETMLESLNDLGVTVSHKDHRELRLLDVFVYPDLEEMNIETDRLPKRIRSSRLTEILEQHPQIMLIGDSQSGKTSLAKVLVRDLLDHGLVPVLIDGSHGLPAGDALERRVVADFVRQYSPTSKEHYLQLPRSRRVIVVDDFHHVAMKSRRRRELIASLAGFSENVVLIAHDLVLEAVDLVSPSVRGDTDVRLQLYRILPFGYVRRNELVEKWLSLDEAPRDQESFVRKRKLVLDTIANVVGKYWLPPYPVYLLAVLQAMEAGTPLDLQTSTHGAYYELFINAALARGSTPENLDIILGYLSHFAYRMFESGSKTMDDDAFRATHREHERRYGLDLDFNPLRDKLIDHSVLVWRDGVTHFKYKYIYYYFVARWMRDHLSDHRVRETIKDLCHTTHLEERANILLFLAHLSKDPLILAELLLQAQSLFAGVVRSEFGDDVTFIEQLGSGSPRLVYRDNDVEETRKRSLAAMDDAEARSKAAEVNEDAETTVLGPIARLNAALKAMQILGQVLRNFPGSIEADDKYLIAKECYNLGLRAFAGIFSAMREHQAEIVSELASVVREDNPELTREEAFQSASSALRQLCEIIGYSVVVYTSRCVGSGLVRQPYSRVLQSDPVPSVRLIDLAVRLEHTKGFPSELTLGLAKDLRGLSYASAVLTRLVLGHFYLLPVDQATKQKVCAALGIEYLAVYGADPSRRLLSPGVS